MKNLSVILALAVTLVGSSAHAQNYGSNKTTRDRDAKNNNQDKDNFQWGVGLMGLAVLGVVVGLTAASAASTPNNYSTK